MCSFAIEIGAENPSYNGAVGRRRGQRIARVERELVDGASTTQLLHRARVAPCARTRALSGCDRGRLRDSRQSQPGVAQRRARSPMPASARRKRTGPSDVRSFATASIAAVRERPRDRPLSGKITGCSRLTVRVLVSPNPPRRIESDAVSQRARDRSGTHCARVSFAFLGLAHADAFARISDDVARSSRALAFPFVVEKSRGFTHSHTPLAARDVAVLLLDTLQLAVCNTM